MTKNQNSEYKISYSVGKKLIWSSIAILLDFICVFLYEILCDLSNPKDGFYKLLFNEINSLICFCFIICNFPSKDLFFYLKNSIYFWELRSIYSYYLILYCPNYLNSSLIPSAIRIELLYPISIQFSSFCIASLLNLAIYLRY